MKVNIEIELPYVTEDGEISEDILDKIVKSASQTMYNSLDAKMKPIIDDIASKLINRKVEEILNNFLNKPITVSNGYKKEDYKSVIDMVETKMTSLYESKFLQTGSCNGQDPLLIKIDNNIKNRVNDMISNFNSKLESEAKKSAEKAVKESSLYQVLEKAGIIK